jgi:hypothetical protein
VESSEDAYEVRLPDELGMLTGGTVVASVESSHGAWPWVLMAASPALVVWGLSVKDDARGEYCNYDPTYGYDDCNSYTDDGEDSMGTGLIVIGLGSLLTGIVWAAGGFGPEYDFDIKMVEHGNNDFGSDYAQRQRPTLFFGPTGVNGTF